MTAYSRALGGRTYRFRSLKDLMAKASPARSGDAMAGIAAKDDAERVLAQMALAEVPLKTFLSEALIPYEEDEVTRLIIDGHDAAAFAPVAHLTVGDFRNWLLSDAADEATLAALALGLTPEMAAAVSKIMRVQDLILVGQKCRVVTKFRNTIGLKGRLSTRLQPNHPTDDPSGIAASIVDGLMYGSGDAVIGVNPATDSVAAVIALIHMLDAVIAKYAIPAQSCVLTHVTTSIEAINRGAVGNNVMYFETGQGSALSANAHHGVDQQTCEARAYAVARKFEPLLVNTVVGFIGPEYLYDGRQIVRAGLEDHFCGKLLGVPMGCDVCYTNHAEADQNDMDTLLTLLAVAGVTYIMGVPGSDDIMLNYQSTSFHDALYARRVLGLRPAPEFEAWLQNVGVFERGEALRLSETLPRPFQRALSSLA